MTVRGVHPASFALAATSLVATALVSPGWVFGKYPNLAVALARGDVTAAQVGDASPAYLLLHVLASPTLVRWFQAGVGAVTVAVLFELLRRRSGLLAAWIGAGVLAVAQQWVVYGAVLEPDLLLGAALAATIALLEWPPFSPRRVALAGLALGFAVSLRPTALLFGVLVVGWLAWRRTSWRSLAAFGLTAAVVAALPSLLLRAKSGHDLRGTMSAGQVFHQSHRPESLGFGASFPSLLKIVEAQATATGPHPPDYAHELYRELARVSEPQRVSAADAEAFWLERTVAFFRLEPRAALGQLFDKAVAFVAPPAGEYDIPAVQALLRGPHGLPLRWITLLAFGGLLVLLGTRSVAATPWALHWAASLAVALLFYFHGRYAVSLVPGLAALVGLGCATAWQERRRRWVVPALAAPLIFLALPSVRSSDRMVERLNAIEASAAGSATIPSAARDRYLDEQAAVPDSFWPTSPHGVGVGADDPDVARLAAQLAVARYGTSSAVDATLAAALWASAGDCDAALALADRAAKSGFVWALGDRSIDPRLIASDCLLRLGRPGEAVAQLEVSNQEHPGRLDLLARLVAAGDVGQKTDVARWDQELSALHDAASVRYALASARRRWGDPQGSLADADWLRSHWPPAAPFAEHERSLSLIELNQPEPALEAWARALEIRAGLHDLNRLDPLVIALSRSAPDDPRVAALVRAHWLERGHAP